jgi:hypothetical protein
MGVATNVLKNSRGEPIGGSSVPELKNKNVTSCQIFKMTRNLR